MSLIASISGVRGTVGGRAGANLTPPDVVGFVSAYAQWLKTQTDSRVAVIGRDARPTGPAISALVQGTLQAAGFDVVDLGLTTTPTLEMAVPPLLAAGGVVLTASHNPVEWNALKLLDQQGEFISATAGERILEFLEKRAFEYAPWNETGGYRKEPGMIDFHVENILGLDLVDVDAISDAKFSVAIDCVNSSGSVALPPLLEQLGVETVHKLYCEPTGVFPHNPEPLPQNLEAIRAFVKEKKADVGFVVDPDVDRLAVIDENGRMIGEEYTLALAADYALSARKSPVVSNLSSSRVLRDVAEKHGVSYHASAVGEVNVVAKMKETSAVIGGEGNGGVIVPDLHYGRDAMVGIALILSYMAKTGKSCAQLRDACPDYFMSKEKLRLPEEAPPDALLGRFAREFETMEPIMADGVKIEYADSWAHIRKSNTEPILRVYTEAPTQAAADELAARMLEKLNALARTPA